MDLVSAYMREIVDLLMVKVNEEVVRFDSKSKADIFHIGQ